MVGKEKLITAAVSMTGFVGVDGNALGKYEEFAKWFDYIMIMAVSKLFSRFSLSSARCSPTSS